MKCPRCGSMDVLDTRDNEKKEILAECQNCQHTWTEKYEPKPSLPPVNESAE